MHLIQILLPTCDNEGREFSHDIHRGIGDELVAHFSGLTAYTRSAAEGFWTQGGQTALDEIVVFEVMVQDIDEAWWSRYRDALEARLRQQSVIIRTHPIRLL